MMNDNKKSAAMGAGEAFFWALRLAVFLGCSLAIPVSLGFETEYVPTALIIGAVSFVMGLVAVGLLQSNSGGRILGALFMILLMVALAVGTLILIVGKIMVDSHKRQNPIYPAARYNPRFTS
jgi:hypothetical protein